MFRPGLQRRVVIWDDRTGQGFSSGCCCFGGMRGDHSSQPLESVCIRRAHQADSIGQGLPVPRPVRAALVVLNDPSAPEAAPGIPEQAQERLAETFASESTKGFRFASNRS